MHRPSSIVLLLLLLCCGASALADDDAEAGAPTPPRLSFIDGEVSYWRSGADAWTRASANLPLAVGDALYAGKDANFEVQFASRSFLRADASSQLTLLRQQEREIQFKLTSGRVSFDIRHMVAGNMVEVSTPHAVFLIEEPGYYRVELDNNDTHFITRRGGTATVTTADGRSLSIYPSEDIVVTGNTPVRVATYAAPAPDAWDRWNDARSDRLGESISARHLSPDIYGVEELDHYGRWRVVPTYGPVWIPHAVGADWVPYSTGFWIWDPYYEWSWVDDAPWGWAPFHYGRWIYIDGYWAWAPGPVQRRAVYAPALVAFMMHNDSLSARISIGTPGLWWVALSWGEPIVPWWGPPHYRGRPHWRGWGGPRLVNNELISQTTIINVGDIRYHHAARPHTILTLPTDKFGRERTRARVETRYRHTDLAPAHGELPVKPSPRSLHGGAPRSVQPPREIISRPVVSTRQPRDPTPPWQTQEPRKRTPAIATPHVVIPPTRQGEDRRTLPRPPLGIETGPEVMPPPRPPRYGEMKRTAPLLGTSRDQPTSREPATERRLPSAPAVSREQGIRPPAPLQHEERKTQRERPLPGEPANQGYRKKERDKGIRQE